MDLIKLDYQMHKENYNTDQCIQIITTGVLAAVQCDLPVYCGTPVYSKIRTKFTLSEVGVCVGIGLTTILGNEEFGMVKDRLLTIYSVQTKFSRVNYFMNVICDDDRDTCWLIHKSYMRHFPVFFNNVLKISDDDFISDNAEICLPTIKSSIYPIMRGPMSKKQAKGESIYWFAYMGYHINYGICIGGDRCIGPDDGAEDKSPTNVIFECNPALQVTRNFPSLSSIAGHVSRSIVVIMRTIYDYLLTIIIRILQYTATHLDWVNISIIYYITTRYTVIEYKQRLAIALITTYCLQTYRYYYRTD